VVVTAGSRRAVGLAAAMAQAAPQLEVLLLPAWDCLPGDGSGPAPSFVGRRAETLLQLARPMPRGGRLLIVPARAVLQVLPRPELMAELWGELSEGEPFAAEPWRDAIERAGYVLDERVDEPGEVALRSETLEVYAATAEMPVRCELADGIITILRRYDPATQRSIEDIGQLALAPASELPLDDATIEQLVGIAGAHGADPEATRDALAQTSGRRLASTFLPLFEDCSTDLFELWPIKRWIIEDGVEQRLEAHRGLIDEALELDTADGTQSSPLATLYRLAQARLLLPEARWRAGLERCDVDRLPAANPALRRQGAASENSATVVPSPVQLLAPSELRPGDYAVHLRHGRGRIVGLESVEAEGRAQDVLAMDYAGDRRILVPVAELDQVWRQAGPAAELRLDVPESETWQERRANFEAEVTRAARLLVRQAKARQRQTAPAIATDARLEAFVRRFGFEETEGQLRAIEAVLDDLGRPFPMDRLVCGDVGYGKTEVALRAAAAVAFAGLQVAVLAPTTLLAMQHADTFRRRFARSGVEVALLTGGLKRAEAEAVRESLAAGRTGIVIGTHALCGRGIFFQRLGLVIVDEEQRFGTAQKKALSRMSAGHHRLAMTATPIPRTLQSALVGLRDISVIDTAPQRRRPVRTVITAEDAAVIRTALARERARGGQSFWIAPRVAEIEAVAARARELLPGGRILVAHGKLRQNQLDKAMLDFAQGRGDVLVATTVIESGIDIPRANTMLVTSPELLGLAQLHQLRGRVGRGARQAHMYLLTDNGTEPESGAMARLNALAATPSLGGGFALAALDMDQRGAGALLGAEQSGHADPLGPELYQHLLERAIRRARGDKVQRPLPEVMLGVPQGIPEDYIPEVQLRLELHRRIARVESREQLEGLRDEIRDRFGPRPPELDMLLRVADIRLACRARGITSLRAGPAGMAVRFISESIAARALRALGLATPSDADRVVLKIEAERGEERLSRTEALLARLAKRGRRSQARTSSKREPARSGERAGSGV
jgi:transcription-repair coupling factor (superfamily II helicase)